jgi:hypothetical protein
MNWLKKGPELKLSELKVPDFLYDLFYDLKDRHLLPLVALLIVAIVGAPIYFHHSSKQEGEPDATLPPAATASAAATGKAGGTIVAARSEPGLRDYRRRLKDYRALDPFRHQGGETDATAEAPASEAAPSTPVAPPEATVVGEESSAPVAAEAPYEPPVYEPPSVPAAESSSGPAPSTGGKTRTRYASSAIDVRIVTVPSQVAEQNEQKKAKRAKPKAQVRRDVPELTMLPARQTPAATFIGLTNDRKKALFVVSSDVVSIFGEAKCVIGSQSCQLLALEPDMPVTFVYGPQEHRYRIELLKIDQTYGAKPRRATLGATKGGHRSHGDGEGGEGGGAAGGPGTEAAGPGGDEPAERG